MHTETAVHSGRDSLGRVITPGRHVLSLHGSRSLVDVTEDDCSNLGIQIRDRWYRLDELDPSAVLSRCDRLDGIPASLSNIDARLKIAQGYREELARVEKALAYELGCECGDGSPLWEGISAAVRDGLGTAVDLLDLAGGLRR